MKCGTTGYMNDLKVTCRATTWFKMRALGMAVLFLGMGCYFFYDAKIGYPEKNEIYFTYKAFEAAGQDVLAVSEMEWKEKAGNGKIDFRGYPVSLGEGVRDVSWPEDLADYDSIRNGWHGAWLAYSAKRKWPSRPEESPFDSGKVMEQWIAGGVCFVLFVLSILLFLRTIGRKMSIDGEIVSAGGRSFNVGDIALLDVRKWKKKGIAYAVVNGRKVRLDGFCYGGFTADEYGGEAEAFMRALKSVYNGDIVDYEEQERG